MFAKTLKLFKKWMNLGVHKEQPFHTQKITVFTNLMTILPFFVSFSSAVSWFFTPGVTFKTFLLAITTSIGLTFVWMLHYRFKNRAARMLFIIVQHLSLFTSCLILPNEFGMGMYWFNLIIMSHLLFDSKEIKSKIFFVVLSFVCSILSHGGHFEMFGLTEVITPDVLKYGIHFNAFNAAINFLLVTTGFSAMNFYFEKKLRENETQILQGNKLASLGEMSGGIAHEINNPLSIIIGRTELLKSKLDQNALTNEFLSNNLSSILNTSRRIAKVVYGLKKFARISENDPKRNNKLIDIVNDTLLLTQEKLKSLGIDTQFEGLENIEVFCNPLQISQVLYNLICNSAEHATGSENKWIRISAKKTRSTVEIHVSDNGHGIPKKVAAKIMEPFFTTKGIGKGTGMGLSISHGIVHSEGGELFYDPTQSNTTFVIRLPRREEDYLKSAA